AAAAARRLCGAVIPSRARGDLGRGRRRRPVRRRDGAVGAPQDRSRAHGHRALCARRGDPAPRGVRAAGRAGLGGQAARSAGAAGGRAGFRGAREAAGVRDESPQARGRVPALRRAGESVTLVDSHCHLDYLPEGPERSAAIARARRAGVGALLTISTKITEFPALRAIAEVEPDVWCSVGIHPHEAAAEPETSAETWAGLAGHPRVIGMGETGLDFYYETARGTARPRCSAPTRRRPVSAACHSSFIHEMRIPRRLRFWLKKSEKDRSPG